MIGQTIANYRILEELGRGGMGVVYKAHDSKLHRPVALKVLRPELVAVQEHRQRFLREALSAAAVAHPYIASVFDVGEAEGALFITMEYVEGQTLRARLAQGALPIPEAHQYATELAEGLATAHQAKLVHRDLKPDNVMVTKSGHVKILDFGLARVVEQRDQAATVSLGKAQPAEVTTQGAILGTPAYMSPEQARGETVDSRSDIFSFGSTVYELVTGRAPFQRATHTDTLASILRDEPVPAHELNPAVPGELNHILRRCLHKEPQERYDDTRDLVAALKDLQAVTPVPSPPPTRRQRRRPRGRLLVALASLMVVAGLLIVRPWKVTQNAEEEVVAASGESSDRPNWILVADFAGPPDDPNMALVARELVVASLLESGTVTPISRLAIKQGLTRAMKPDTTRIMGDVAKELAFRAGSQTYVEGAVDRVLGGFAIRLRVLDTGSDRLVATVTDVAANEEIFFATLRRMGDELRMKLGEKQELVDARRTMQRWTPESATSSFAAFKSLVQAQEMLFDLDHRGCIDLTQRAVTLDPDLADAWLTMGYCYRILGMVDSARVARDQASRRQDRLSPRMRIYLQAGEDRPYEERIRIYKSGLREFPFEVGFHSNLGTMFKSIERYAEAYNAYMRAADVAPFGPWAGIREQAFRCLLQLGRYEEAKHLLSQIDASNQPHCRLRLELHASNWDSAETLALALMDNPTIFEKPRICLAAIRAARGQVGDAIQFLEQSIPDQTQSGQRFVYCNALSQLLGIVRRGLRFPAACADSTQDGLITQGVHAALQGDHASAGQFLEAFRQRETPIWLVNHERYLEACVAARQGDWRQVVRLLESEGKVGPPPYGGWLPSRWLLAEAYEHLEKPDKAVESFELVLSPVKIGIGATLLRPLFCAFAHHRLVLLYSKMGRAEDARRHWDVFEKTFTRPDPELMPMFEEARRALAETAARI